MQDLFQIGQNHSASSLRSLRTRYRCQMRAIHLHPYVDVWLALYYFHKPGIVKPNFAVHDSAYRIPNSQNT